MNINRHNYEEYFLLYVDNELTAAERKDVEAFVTQNPDLEEELVMMLQSVFRPDENIVFKNKKTLLKNTAGLINESNCAEYFVLYGDDELTNEEKAQVELFVYHHPQYQAEFELIHQARLIPDHSLVYPDKNELYRTEEDEKVAPFPWWRMAVAAVVVLFLGAAGWFIAIDKPEGPVVVETNPIHDSGTNNTVAVQTPVTNKGQSTNAVKEKKEITESASQLAVNDLKQKTTITGQPKNDPGKISGKIEPGSNIDEPVYVPQQMLVKTDEPKDPIVMADRLMPKTVEARLIKSYAANPVVEAKIESVDLPVKQTEVVFVEYYDDNDEALKVANASLNKNSLRGLFRKVSRVFDKNGNDPENENRKGIQIASFEFALK